MAKDCIFCKIASGEIPGEKIYEDEKVFAILDIHPYVLGHCLVIPKKHHQYIWDIDEYDYFMNVVREIAKVLEKVFDTDLVQGGIAGVDIAHAHFHLFPRTDEGQDGFPDKPLEPKPSEVEMKWVVEKVRKAFGKEPVENSEEESEEIIPSISDLKSDPNKMVEKPL